MMDMQRTVAELVQEAKRLHGPEVETVIASIQIIGSLAQRRAHHLYGGRLNRIATMKPIIDAPEYAQLLKKAQERAKKAETEPAPSEGDKDTGAAVAGKAKLKGGSKGKSQTTGGKAKGKGKAKPSADDSADSESNASGDDASEGE